MSKTPSWDIKIVISNATMIYRHHLLKLFQLLSVKSSLFSQAWLFLADPLFLKRHSNSHMHNFLANKNNHSLSWFLKKRKERARKTRRRKCEGNGGKRRGDETPPFSHILWCLWGTPGHFSMQRHRKINKLKRRITKPQKCQDFQPNWLLCGYYDKHCR